MGSLEGLGPALRLMMWLAAIGAIAALVGGIYGVFWLLTHVRFV